MGRLVILPKRILVWCYDSVRASRAARTASFRACVTLGSVRHLAADEASSNSLQHMLDTWRIQGQVGSGNHKSGVKLIGEYVVWEVEDVKVVRDPRALVRDDVTGNLTYVNELNQAGWAKLLGCSFTDGTLVDGEVLGLRRAMLQVPVGIADLLCSSSCPSELATPLSVPQGVWRPTHRGHCGRARGRARAEFVGAVATARRALAQRCWLRCADHRL